MPRYCFSTLDLRYWLLPNPPTKKMPCEWNPWISESASTKDKYAYCYWLTWALDLDRFHLFIDEAQNVGDEGRENGLEILAVKRVSSRDIGLVYRGGSILAITHLQCRVLGLVRPNGRH